MKSATYKLVFNRKGANLKPDKKALVQIEIYYQGLRKYISTGLYIEESQWNEADRKIQKHPSAIDMNKLLRDKVTELADFEYKIKNQDEEFTLDSFDMLIDGRDRKNFHEYLVKEIASRADISKETRKHHETLANRLKEHGKIKYFRDLTFDNISDLHNWYLKKGIKQSTLYNQHKILKVYINRAISSGLIEMQKNPYIKFKVKRANNHNRKYLTVEELNKIEGKIFEMDRLNVVRDLFLFSCFTGLAYSDAAKLTPDIVTDESGEQWIKIRRKKTDKETVIMLLPKALAIIEKYKGMKKGKLLPYITNQRMNSYLKIIADQSDVKKELTTHVARHTFATTVTLMNGVSLEVVQKMLGHTSIRTTEIYAKLVNERIQKEMGTLRDNLK
jgi:integrase/recombinase XerD